MASGIFIELYPLWNNKNILTKNKIRIFHSNVKLVLLYGCKTRKVTTQITNKLYTFLNYACKE
jgi:hypothetical protein